MERRNTLHAHPKNTYIHYIVFGKRTLFYSIMIFRDHNSDEILLNKTYSHTSSNKMAAMVGGMLFFNRHHTHQNCSY
jgi:hypothetical protein